MTGTDIITEALLLLKRITPGQTPSTDEMNTSQLKLNMLLGEWNAQALAVYSAAPITIFLTSGVGDYNVTPRPVKIEAWNMRSTSGQSQGGVPMDAAAFAEIAIDRGAVGSRVKALNYDAAFPTPSVHLYPKPNGGTLELWVWEALAVIADFTATLAYPPGYLKAITYNLAVALAPQFATRAPLDPAVTSEAAQGKQDLASANASQHHAAVPG
jgi:hypothetical protein